MRLKSVRVNGLFGLFNHDVKLRMDERVTIIHAPNGYGKTVLLKLIAGFFGGSMTVFRRYEYETVAFELEDGSTVVIRQVQNLRPVYRDGDESPSFTVEFQHKNEISRWDPDNADKDERTIPPTALERYVPGISRIGPRLYRTIEGDRITHQEAIERYWHILPAGVRRGQHFPEWLVNIRSGINCSLIETQRLTVSKAEHYRSDRESPTELAVKSYADGLAKSLNRTLAESATLSQSLDRTFPNRILAKMQHPPELDEKTVRSKLAELEEKRGRLAKVDLLEKSDEGGLLSHETFNDAALKILGEYASDAAVKLQVFDVILAKVELFTDILNSRFSFKKINASRDQGFIFTDLKGRNLPVHALSSGEQHELILLYSLIFRTTDNTLLLIDEPEISLHIAWQKKFLSDMMRIISLAPIDVVLATHSPQLISGNLDLTTQLRGPHDARKRT